MKKQTNDRDRNYLPFGFILFCFLIVCLVGPESLLFGQVVQPAWSFNTNRKIIVSGDQYYPPFEFINENGQPDGFNVELFELLAGNLGLDYTIELLPWNLVRSKAENQQIDVVLGLMVSRVRSEKLLFGTPHSMMTHGIFTLGSREINSLTDLKGLKVAVQNQDYMHDLLLEKQITPHIITAETQLDALRLVEQGVCDAALIGDFQGAELIRKHKLFNINLSTGAILPQPYAMAVSKGNEQLLAALNTGLWHLKVSGEYDRLRDKWFRVIEQKQVFQTYKNYIFLAILLFVMLVAFSVFLRWRVKKVTQNLRESEEKFRQLIQDQNDLIVKVDAAGNFTYISPSYCRFFGKTEADLMQKSFMPLVHEEDVASTEEALKKLQFPPHHIVHEQRALSANGWKWLSWSDTALLDESGKITEIIGVGRDITAQKEAETALKASEQKLLMLLDQATNIAIQGYNKDGIVHYWNEASTRLYGFSKEEAIGKSLFELIIPDEMQQKVKVEVAKMLSSNEKAQAEELLLKHRSGQLIPVYSNHVVIEIPGKEKEFFCIDIDLSQQKKDQALIQQTNAQLKAIFENSFNLFISLDLEGRVVLFNQTASKFAKDILGIELKPGLLLSQVTERNKMDSFAGNFHQAALGESVYAERSITGIDGKKHWFDFHLSPSVNDQKQVVGIVMIGKDVTMSRRALMVEKVLFDITDAVSLTTDLSSLLGVIKTSLSELIDTSNLFIAFYQPETDMLSTLNDEDAVENIPCWSASGSLTGMVIKKESALLLTDEMIGKLEASGQIKRIGLHSKVWLGVPLRSGKEVIGAIVVQSFDNPNAYDGSSVELMEFVSGQISLVIQRQKDLINLIAAKLRAEESDKLKTSFLNNLSHEIRTPMNSMFSLIEMMASGEFSPQETAFYGDMIIKSGKQLLQIVHDTVDVASIQTGQERVNFKPVDLKNDLQPILSACEVQATEKNLEFEVDFRLPAEQTIILTDKAKLLAIVQKLTDNAFKFTNIGKIRLRVSWHDNRFEVAVSDTGIGIDPGYHDVIFQTFRKIENDKNSVYRGNGLGLSIVSAYVQLLDGSIDLQSSPGVGSEFTISWPALIYNEEPSITSPKPINELKNDRFTILLAEDEDTNLEFLKSVIGSEKYHLLIARDGLEVLRHFDQAQRIDLVLMDIKMPLLSGLDATKQLRKRGIEIPIIAVTAYALLGDEQKALISGCNGYITKPYTRDAILSYLRPFLP